MPTQLCTLKSYWSEVEAELDRSILAENGVHCELANVGINAVYPLVNIIGIELMVPESHRTHSLQILSDFHRLAAEQLEPQHEPDHDGPLCPRCGSDLVSTMRPWLWLGLLLPPCLPLLLIKRSYCSSCQHCWS